jgi:hypothetical protein
MPIVQRSVKYIALWLLSIVVANQLIVIRSAN